MGKSRRGEAEGIIDHDLTARRDQKICAADDFGNAHSVIVGHNRKFIGWSSVLSPDDEIAKIDAGRVGLVPGDGVLIMDGLSSRDAESPVGSSVR